MSTSSQKVVVIGVTGSGKSSLCNALTGEDVNGQSSSGFPVSAEPDSCTWNTTVRQASWLGNGPQFTIIDTPGLDDPSGRDTENIVEMVEKLKEIQYINAFLIVFNGQNPRLDRSLLSMLQLFKGMFGPGFLHNTIIEFSRWSFDKRAQSMRQREGLSEMSQHRDWNKKLQDDLGINIEIPTFYVDARYLEEDPTEAAAFKEQTDRLWKLISTLQPYQCKDFEAVMAEQDRLEEEARISDEKRQNAELKEKMAQDAEAAARNEKARADEEREKAESRAREVEDSTRKQLVDMSQQLAHARCRGGGRRGICAIM